MVFKKIGEKIKLTHIDMNRIDEKNGIIFSYTEHVDHCTLGDMETANFLWIM